MLRARLKVIGGKHRGKTIPLLGSKFLIGREQDCQLRPTSELISRHHCAITVDEFTVRLRDLGSTNGSYVNEQRVHGQVKLKTGDMIRVGKLRFEMLITELSEEESRKLSPSGSATALAGLLADHASGDTTEMSGSDTAHEIRLPLVVTESDSSLNQTITGDSGAFELNPAAAARTGKDSALQLNQVEADTTVAAHHALVPVETAAYPAAHYQQPTGYPPMGAYPPPMPSPYPQMPMGYPPMPYGYPQPGMYSAPMYAMPQPPALYPPQQPQQMESAPEPESGERSRQQAVDALPLVTLPDPSQTGVKAPPAPPPPKVEEAPAAEGAAPVVPKKNPSQASADIIRQHMQRRPGT